MSCVKKYHEGYDVSIGCPEVDNMYGFCSSSKTNPIYNR